MQNAMQCHSIAIHFFKARRRSFVVEVRRRRRHRHRRPSNLRRTLQTTLYPQKLIYFTVVPLAHFQPFTV